MNRILSRAAIVVLLALPACSTAPNVNQAIADAQIVASGVQVAYDSLKAFDPALTSSDTDAQIQANLKRLPGALTQLQAATTAASQASGLRAVEADVNGVLNLAAGVVTALHPPQSVVVAFQAAEVLIPVIEGIANQLVPATVGGTAVPVAFRSTMSPDQAWAALTAVGVKR